MRARCLKLRAVGIAAVALLVPHTIMAASVLASLKTIAVPENFTNAFDVRLSAQPAVAVTVSVARTAGDSNIVVQAPATCVFTSVNWSAPQSITLFAAPDSDSSNGEATVTCTAPGYTAASVLVTELECGIAALPPEVLMPAGDVVTNHFSLRLTAPIAAAVTVSIARVAGDEDIYAADPTNVVFTANNWFVPQTAVVWAVADADGLCGRAQVRCSAPGLAAVEISAYEHETALFTLGNAVTQTNPARFGLVFSDGIMRAWYPQPYVNIWNPTVAFEPMDYRHNQTVDIGSTNYIESKYVPSTKGGVGWWKSFTDGYWDGANIRFYRMAGGGLDLIRTGVVTKFYGTVGGQERIYFTGISPTIQAGDFYILEMTRTSTPVAPGSLPPSILFKLSAMALTNTVSWGLDDTECAPDGGSTCSLKVTINTNLSSDLQFYHDYLNSGNPKDVLTLVVGKTYEASMWLKCQGTAAVNTIQFDISDMPGVARVFTVSTVWTRYAFQFVAPGQTASNSYDKFRFRTRLRGSWWVDNLTIHQVDVPRFDWMPAVTNELLQFRPGALRTFTGYDYYPQIENWLRPPLQQHAEGYRPEDTLCYSLGMFLTLCKRVGAEPWLILQPMMREADHALLMDYLTAPTNTPWGARRAADGQSEPWTNVFRAIYFEICNEAWNQIFTPKAWPAAPANYAAIAEYSFRLFKQHPAYRPAAFRFIANGFGTSTSASPNGWTDSVSEYATNANIVDIAYYIGGWDGLTLPSADNREFWREQLRYSPRLVEPKIMTIQGLIANNRLGQTLAMYEGGPGYPMPSAGQTYSPEAEYYGKALAPAVDTFDFFMFMAAAGFEQMMYYKYSYGRNWSSHADYLSLRRHATWLALALRNQQCSGALTAVNAYGVRMVDLPPLAGYQLAWDGSIRWTTVPGRNAVPMTLCYGFRDGARYACVLIAREVDAVTDVQLNVPFTPAAQVELYRLTGAAPDAQNTEATQVQVLEEHRDDGTNVPYRLALAPHSVCVVVFTAQPGVPPAAPSQVFATNVTASQVTLRWTDNAVNEGYFSIERRTAAEPTYAMVGYTAGPDITQWTDATVAAGQLYVYRVSAVNAAGEGVSMPITASTDFNISTLAPVADSFVGSRELTNLNFGITNYLNTLQGTGIRYSYLKFDVAAMPPAISSAVFRIYQTTAYTNVLYAKAVADHTWGETSIIWENQPAAGAVIASAEAVPKDWTEFDLSDYVRAVRTNGGMVDVQLSSVFQSKTYIFSSREATVNQPELRIVASGPGPTGSVPLITSATLPAGTVSSYYSATLAATGGIPPLTWDVLAGTLPAGITLSSNGLLAGTSTVEGAYQFTARVRDARQNVDSRPFTLSIVPEPAGFVALLGWACAARWRAWWRLP